MNDNISYDPIQKILHWTILLLVITQFATVWLAPEGVRGGPPETLVSLHMSFGVVVLLLMLIRFIWRLTHHVPEAVSTDPKWQQRSARLLHFTFYFLLILLPLSGWIWAGARGWDVTLFGFFKLPAIVAKGFSLGRTLGGVHQLVATLLLVLIAVHVAAAVYHWKFKKDGVMERMMPKQKKTDK